MSKKKKENPKLKKHKKRGKGTSFEKAVTHARIQGDNVEKVVEEIKEKKNEVDKLHKFMQSYGRNLGFGIKPFVHDYKTEWRKGLAEDVIKNKNKYSTKIIEETKRFLTEYDNYIKSFKEASPWQEDKLYLTVLHGSKKVVTEAHKDVVNRFKELSEQIGLSRRTENRLIKDFLKEHKLEEKKYVYNKKYYDEYISHAGTEFLRKTANLDKGRRRHQLEIRSKLLTSQHEGVDLPFAIAKGKEKLSYEKLLNYIKNSPKTLFHPKNLWALRKSKKFELEYFDEMTKYWSKTKAINWWEKNILGNRSTYRQVDPGRREETQEKRARYRKITVGDVPIERDNKTRELTKKFNKKKKKKKK